MMQTLDIDTLADVRVTLSALLGRADVSIREVLDFQPGNIVPLHVSAESAIPLLINGVAIAHGEIVALESGTLALEIVDVISPPQFSMQQ